MGVRTLLVAAILGWVSVLAGAADAPAVVKVDLPKAGYDLAVDPATGGVAVVNPNEDTVTLFPGLSAGGSVAGAVSRTVPRAPLGVVYKRVGEKGYFAVVCHDGNKMVVFDAAGLTAVKEIPLTVNEPSSVFASLNAGDPYVYYCGARGHESAVACVNLATMREEGTVQGLGGRNSAMDGAISADGAVLYTRGPWSPSGFASFRMLPAKAGQAGRFSSPLHYDHRSVDRYVPDALGLYVATGQQLYAADLKREVAKLPLMSVACFVPDRPIIIGFAERGGPAAGQPRVVRRFGVEVTDSPLQAVSYNTFKAVGERVAIETETTERPVNANTRNGQADFKRLAFAPRVAYDAKNQNVLALTADHVHVVPLKAFAVPAEPLLFVTANVPGALTVEQKATIAMKAADPGVKVELASGPAGAALVNGTLLWTPTAEQIGVHVVSLKLTGGGVERTQEMSLTVSRNEVALPFVPQFSRLSSDGSAVVVAANAQADPNDGGGRRGYGRASPAPAGTARVALVGLDGGAVVERELLVSVAAVAADAKYAYVALRDSDALYVLDRKDLSDVKRLFTAGRTAALVSGSDECLLVQTDKGTTAIDPRTLTPIEALSSSAPAAAVAARMGQDPAAAALAAPYRLADGWVFDGVVYDAKLRTARSALRPVGIATVRSASGSAADQRRRNFEQMNGAAPRPLFVPWGVYVEGTSLRRLGGQNVAQLPQGAVTVVLPGAPAAASLVYTAKYAENAAQGHAEIVLRDLVSGSPNATLVLADGPVDAARAQEAERLRSYGGTSPLQLYVAGDRLVALCYDRLYVLKTPALAAAQFPVPLHFAADQGVTVADGAAAVTKALAVRSAAGDAAGVEFSLAVETPGVDLDRAKGTLTVTAGPLLQAAAETLAAADNSAAGILGDGRGLAAYLPAASARFKQLTGREPKGIPAMLPITVNARDRSLQVATVDHAILLDVPREMVQAKAAAVAAAAPANAGYGVRPTTRPTTMRAMAVGAGSSEERIEQLERKVQDLEARIDLLMRVVGQRER